MDMPKIGFEPLLDTSEECLLKKIAENSSASCFLVYLRCKYMHEYDWEYLVECCGIHDGNCIEWFNDWWEGQQCVEYLGIAVIDAE